MESEGVFLKIQHSLYKYWQDPLALVTLLLVKSSTGETQPLWHGMEREMKAKRINEPLGVYSGNQRDEEEAQKCCCWSNMTPFGVLVSAGAVLEGLFQTLVIPLVVRSQTD